MRQDSCEESNIVFDEHGANFITPKDSGQMPGTSSDHEDTIIFDCDRQFLPPLARFASGCAGITKNAINHILRRE